MAEVTSNTKTVKFSCTAGDPKTFEVKGDETLLDCCKRMAQAAKARLEKVGFKIEISDSDYHVWMSGDKMEGLHRKGVSFPADYFNEATWAQYKGLSMEKFVGLQNLVSLCVYEISLRVYEKRFNKL